MKRIFKCIFVVILIFLIFSSNSFARAIPDVSTEDLYISSDCILIVEKEYGDILYEKNAYTRMYPASTTKILTAIIVLENSYLNEKVTVSRKCFIFYTIFLYSSRFRNSEKNLE